MTTKIEWCNETINPIIGCSKISEGCDNCYAEKMACRLAHMGNNDYINVVDGPTQAKNGGINWFSGWNGKTVFRPEELEKPMKWKKPRRIFVCSMGDLFHNSVSYDHQLAVFEMMRKAYWHTFFVLTKRPGQMRVFIHNLQADKGLDFIRWPLPNVFLGVTAENQAQAERRIPVLATIPAEAHFVSIEPMLGPVELTNNFRPCDHTGKPLWPCSESLMFALDWVICGGESGPNARPMSHNWVRFLRDQCAVENTPFFFKQWGEWVSCLQTDSDFNPCVTNRVWMNAAGDIDQEKKMAGDYFSLYRIGKKKAGRLLDGVEHSAIIDQHSSFLRG